MSYFSVFNWCKDWSLTILHAEKVGNKYKTFTSNWNSFDRSFHILHLRFHFQDHFQQLKFTREVLHIELRQTVRVQTAREFRNSWYVLPIRVGTFRSHTKSSFGFTNEPNMIQWNTCVESKWGRQLSSSISSVNTTEPREFCCRVFALPKSRALDKAELGHTFPPVIYYMRRRQVKVRRLNRIWLRIFLLRE